jgi:glutathione S-transferase
MSPTLKLVYFDITGRAEPARLMFAYKNVKYEDKRVTQEEWKTMKPSK